jgi:hypothetical protein
LAHPGIHKHSFPPEDAKLATAEVFLFCSLLNFLCFLRMTDAALSRLEGVCARLEALEARLGKGGSGGSGAPASSAAAAGGQEEAPFVKAFDDLTSEFFGPLEIGAKACGPDVVKIIDAYKEGLVAQRAMLFIAVAALHFFPIMF